MKKKKEKPVDKLMWDKLRKEYQKAAKKKEDKNYNIIVEINKHFKK